MPRAVLDPSVLVSALISPSGPSARLLVELSAGAFELVTSPLLLAELTEVLVREKFRRYVSEDEAAAYVEFLRRESLLAADPEPSAEQLSEDPDDEYLVTLARAARVDALVSGDQHLLRLRGRIPVTTAREFLERLVALNELARSGLRRRPEKRAFRQESQPIGLTIDVTDVADAIELLEGPAAR